MKTISTAEKIETIVLYQHSGILGKITEYMPGMFRVDCDDISVLVRRGPNGWHVSFKGKEAANPELCIAARNALGKKSLWQLYARRHHSTPDAVFKTATCRSQPAQ